ncbi:SGNH/GDSL hydrolase family protein [Stackebrandtia nassauensis]|uniref:Lipolytic protein G-D-S-L family n=1 Tax=Stackebrandtia nassauensis (strain DSM 44728 / CIP 108903 / NRRL B-16338 / NBRC 102104 / LLR-40K-21) TaxID=446470 RepID=D3PZ44_STANL|nr:SGNH/GDSL hydrolase family protein [Stackebrandtia nassauensis]ADD45473.1 lipolytic protein G-D-S-L family [Stackebrandtia nassauensis DSM 44728]
MAERFTGYVALGDSFTEGMNDHGGDGIFRGWADLAATRMAEADPELKYANLAIRGKLFDEVVDEQVPAALRLRPDLVSFVAGGNDALRTSFDPARMAGRFHEAIRVLTASGARVLMSTGFHPPRLPAHRLLRKRIVALNEIIRKVAKRHDAALVDLFADEAFADTRMWSEDRLHMSALGHRRVAHHVCQALSVDPDPKWSAPLPTAPGKSWLRRRREDAAWTREHALPWVQRRFTGQSSGDMITPKRPQLMPVSQVGS